MTRSWNAATLAESDHMTPARCEKDETLRYLGYGGQDLSPEIVARIKEAKVRCERIARPAATWRAFPSESLHLPGNDITAHLAGALEIVLMATTLGHGVDRELRRLSLTDPLGQVIFDAASTAAVERLSDEIEAQIRVEARDRGLYCSWRFSPGYGDLPLSVQGELLARLDAERRLGITLTPSNLMVPTKSVTAIIGLHPTPQSGVTSSCSVCTLRPNCSMRERGMTCR